MYRTFDLRSLALFRIGLGFLIIIDLMMRATFLVQHYTDQGVLPRYAVLLKFWRTQYWSLHMINGETWFQVLLFLIMGVAAFFVLVGYRTRLFIILSWLLMISLQNRIGIVLSGGDMLLRSLLLFAIFLPLGARFSVDESQSKDSPASHDFTSWAGFCLMLQLAFVYLFVLYIRRSGPYWWDGTALHYAFSIDQMTTGLGQWLKHQKDILSIGTYITMGVEFLGPVLIFIPFAVPRIRGAVIPIMIAMHISITFFFQIGLFPWISCVSWLFLIPSFYWEHKKVSELTTQIGDRFKQTKMWHFLKQLPANGAPLLPSRRVEVIAIITIIYIFAWNMRSTRAPFFNLPKALDPIGRTFRLEQKWNLFAPYPIKNDGWYVMKGELKSGKEVNLWYPDQPVSFEKPEDVAAMYTGHRQQKYMMNLWTKNFKSYRLYFGKYICRKWNRFEKRKDKLQTFELFYMKERTLPQGEAKPEKIKVWGHACFKKDTTS